MGLTFTAFRNRWPDCVMMVLRSGLGTRKGIVYTVFYKLLLLAVVTVLKGCG